MSNPVVRVESLSKRYLINHQQGAREGLRQAVDDALSNPLRWLNNRRRALRQTQEEYWALKDVSIDINQGEVVGIIGRNGAGKSTLLKILSRITEPTTGKITIEGRIASLLEVGTGFHPELTGRENIFLNGAILGMKSSEIRQKFDEIVAFAGVEKFLDTPVKRYSSGMYVRLAFAVAAHLESDILIVDEVLAVGDAQFQKKCLGKMDDISKHCGRTVLIVSHQMASVSNLCSKCVVLNGGRVSFYGETKTAVELYNGLSETRLETRNPAAYRAKWAKPYITGSRLLSLAGKETDQFPLGSGFVVELQYKCPSTHRIKQPIMGIVIRHSTFGAITTINMRMSGVHPEPSGAAATIRCIVPQLSLVHGSYTLDIWLGDGATDVDMLSEYLPLIIEESDVYNSGHPPSTHFGVLFIHADWQLTETSS
jgi:lipopolysaccharide transport system ATP-binding protein